MLREGVKDAVLAEAPAVRGGSKRLGRLGLWTKSSVREDAFSTVITKHTRSGPRLGNGAFVYLTEIGSM